MERKNNIITIIICITLIIGVTIIRLFDGSSQKNGKDNVQITPVILSSDIVGDEVKDDLNLVDEPILYKETLFELKNGESLYSLALPSGIYTNMIDEIQSYIENNVLDYNSITEVTIIDKTIEVTKDFLTYNCRLNNKNEDQLFIKVNLQSFEYEINPINSQKTK